MFKQDSYLTRLAYECDIDNEEKTQARQLNPFREKTVVTHYSDLRAVSMQSKLVGFNKNVDRDNVEYDEKELNR